MADVSVATGRSHPNLRVGGYPPLPAKSATADRAAAKRKRHLPDTPVQSAATELLGRRIPVTQVLCPRFGCQSPT